MIDQLLEQILLDGIANDACETDRSRMMLNITPATGRFLDLMIRECLPGRILEIGTSNGYSTIWLGQLIVRRRWDDHL